MTAKEQPIEAKVFKIGDRVFHHCKPDSLGTVVGDAYATDSGLPQQAVLWDDSGLVVAWDPIFYFPEGTPFKDLPDTIQSGRYFSSKWIPGCVLLPKVEYTDD